MKILLLAVGLLIAAVFLAELVRAARARRQAAIAAAVQRRKAQLGQGRPCHRPARSWPTTQSVLTCHGREGSRGHRRDRVIKRVITR